MNIKVSILSRLRRRLAAFSIMEVTVGMGIIGTTIAALFSALAAGFFTVRMARENLRATQIMLEKVETIRLYSWDQVTSPNSFVPTNFIPTNFTAKYNPYQVGTNGVIYTGTLTITPAPISASYSNDLRMVTVTLSWKTGSLNRSRQFRSYVSRYGLQDYIY